MKPSSAKLKYEMVCKTDLLERVCKTEAVIIFTIDKIYI